MNNPSSPYISGRRESSSSSSSAPGTALTSERRDEARILQQQQQHHHHHSSTTLDRTVITGVKDQALASAAAKKYEQNSYSKMPPNPSSHQVGDNSPGGQMLQLPGTSLLPSSSLRATYSTQIQPRPPDRAAGEEEGERKKRMRTEPPNKAQQQMTGNIWAAQGSNATAPFGAHAAMAAPHAATQATGSQAAAGFPNFHQPSPGLGPHGGLAPGVPIMPPNSHLATISHIPGMPLRLPANALGVPGFHHPALTAPNAAAPFASLFALREQEIHANRLSQILNRPGGVDPALLGSIGLLGRPAAAAGSTMPGIFGDFSSGFSGAATAYAPGQNQLVQGSLLVSQHGGGSGILDGNLAASGRGAQQSNNKRSSGSRSNLSSVRVEGLLDRQQVAALPTVPETLPAVLALADDEGKLSAFQLLLRNQIEAFTASSEEVTTHARGRNRPITLQQVGIRCRHCKKLPPNQRTKGSVYFPFSLVGLYQAAQNMGASHFQGEVCSEMPEDIKNKFVEVLACKSTIGAGKSYWARSAQKLGLIDSDHGIKFVRDLDGPRTG